MSQFVIYINLEKYLAQWVRNHFGDPVVFPAQSNANAVIRTFISRLPAGLTPDLPKDDLLCGKAVAFSIPDSKAKPARYFNYMGRRGKLAVKEVVRDLFKRSLWNDMSPLEGSNIGLNTRISAWCEMHGIATDHVETVRQCYYRMRDAYALQGVNLRSCSRKK
jgi:hypothetical protein